MKAMKNRRGFNLIEVAIVVVILGLLGSAALVPITSILIEETYDRERAAIQQRAEMAVMGYAARHKTPGAIVSLGGNANQRFEIPAGRPYLPCPDISGDGYENRNNYDPLGVQLNSAITVSNGIVNLTSFVSGTDDLNIVGACSAMRGFLPWKTLGLPARDTWGNLRTYAVDNAFSHSIVGFNHNTIGDNFSQHLTLTGGGEYQRRSAISGSAQNINQPIGLCLGVTGLCDPANLPTLAYGDLAPTATLIGRRNYNARDIKNGLAFVIVSHGRNGFGAGKYNPRGGTVQCNQSMTSINNHENANYPFVDNPAAALITGVCNSQDIMERSAGFFTIRRRSDIDADRTFDDVMIWATREKLLAFVGNQAPDLPLFVLP